MTDDYFHAVSSHADAESIEAAIKVPEYLWSDDGRRYDLREWQPRVCVGDVVTVTLTAIVRLPKK